MKFLIISSFLSFKIGSIAQNENPETLEIIDSLNTLNFLGQISKTLPIYARIMMLRVSAPVRPK